MKIKVIKIVSWTLCLCVLTFCAGLISYEITTKRLNQTQGEMPTADTAAEIAVQAKAAEQTQSAAGQRAESLEYYVARMNGKKLCIYICRSNTEEFAYAVDVDYYSLSEQDQVLLTQGVVLYNNEELAKFIEDFTS